MVTFWYIALTVVLAAGIALGVRRAAFDATGDATAADPSAPSVLARVYAWFGVGDIEEDLALAATLITGGAVSLIIHAIAHGVMRTYPGWFGGLALVTGLVAGIGVARLLSKGASGAW